MRWGQHGERNRSGNLQDGREHRRHPGGEGRTCEGENGAEGALRNGLNDRRGNESRNVRVKGLGRVKREEVGKEAGGVGRSHGGTRDSVGGRFGSDPGGEDVQT